MDSKSLPRTIFLQRGRPDTTISIFFANCSIHPSTFFCKLQIIQMIMKSFWAILHFGWYDNCPNGLRCINSFLLCMILSFANDPKNPPPFKEDLFYGFSSKTDDTLTHTTPSAAENLISVTPEGSFFVPTVE